MSAFNRYHDVIDSDPDGASDLVDDLGTLKELLAKADDLVDRAVRRARSKPANSAIQDARDAFVLAIDDQIALIVDALENASERAIDREHMRVMNDQGRYL